MADVEATLELLRDLGDAPPRPPSWAWLADERAEPFSPPGFTRGDRRASVWCYAEPEPGEWVCGPASAQGDYNCSERWGRRGFTTAEAAMAYADAQLAEEDRRG